MAFTTQAVTSVQSQISGFPLSKLLQVLEAVDIIGGAVVNSSGTITIGGRSLTNQQYYAIYEMIEPMF